MACLIMLEVYKVLTVKITATNQNDKPTQPVNATTEHGRSLILWSRKYFVSRV